ncbi:MAG: HDOD domain-containing protein [Deltaproteobacteria bacterium]|nr:HDOD domain-containing protein [Deltaproteobacteria bacterium]
MISDEILKSIKNIPAFPAVALKVMTLIDDPDFSLMDVVDVIKYDQAVTANILRICNSAYFGLRYKVETVRDAVMRLGQQNVVRAVQVSGVSKFYKNAKGYGLEADKLWEHSVGVALMSQILSRRIFHCEDARLYTTSLLHDIGKVVMGEFVDKSFQNIYNLVSDKGISFLEAEEEVLGINHAELGGKIASHWNFPEDMRDAIVYHHRPDLMPDGGSSSAWLVYLADQACIMMGIGLGSDGLAYKGLSEVIVRFKLRQRDFEECIMMMLGDLESAKELLGIV